MRRLMLAVIATAGVFLGVASSGSAEPPIIKISPDQFFSGAVNGVSQNAVIRVVCPGPETTVGHPVSGQPVEVRVVLPPSAATLGFTGNAARIQANLIYSIGTIEVVAKLVRFSYYNDPAAISTKLDVPCAGAGSVAFGPVNGGRKARVSTVPVTFENIAVAPEASAPSRSRRSRSAA